MRCEICHKYPHVIKQFHPRGLVPMAANGTRYRGSVADEHIQTDYHKECERLYRLSTIVGENSQTSLEIAIDKANLQMVNHVGKLMTQIFYDAKNLNLSAHSWPARYVVNAASFAYDSQQQKESKSIIPKNLQMQYVNKPGHLLLLTSIMNSHLTDFMKKINDCWAVSLRADGSVDSTQIDKIYVMAKIINLDGSSELIFIGIAQQTERKAIGLKNATMKAIETIIVDKNKGDFLRKVSSICTDGTNVNIGEKNSLWVLLDDEMEKIESEIPLIKIWCAVHRSELAWKDTDQKVSQVNKVFSVLSKISTHFHQSGLRTAELEKVAKENGLKICRIPQVFTVRWCEFSFNLLRSILISWKAIVLYCKEHPKEAEPAGFLRYLTTIENLKLIAFLADVLFTYQRFQKKIQSDRLTIISLMSNVASTINSLEKMESTPLIGGFERNLAAQISTEPSGGKKLKEIKLLESQPTRFEATNVHEVRKQTLQSLRNFLENRFEADDVFLKMIEPLINFNSTANIEIIHTTVAPDLSLPNLSLQFDDIVSVRKEYESLSLSEVIVRLCKTSESRENYKELITVLARIAACTPHSADTERCISADHRLKSKFRASFNLETENKYLYIHYNMPDLDEWNPTAAANLFFAEKTRRERDASSDGVKIRAQPYFKGIFSEAQNLADPDVDQQSDDEIERCNTIFEF